MQRRCDTVVVTRVDTVTVMRPRYVTETVMRTDTVVFRDTVLVPVPVVQRYYRGAEWEAWVSGYLPKLDSLNMFARVETVTITRTEKVRKKLWKWALGVQCGYGWNGCGLSPYVGVGLQYTLVRF